MEKISLKNLYKELSFLSKKRKKYNFKEASEDKLISLMAKNYKKDVSLVNYLKTDIVTSIKAKSNKHLY